MAALQMSCFISYATKLFTYSVTWKLRHSQSVKWWKIDSMPCSYFTNDNLC